ncbi:MAG: hypothetical protein ACXVBW_15525, partial [Bdellovibrionota bacterium]
MLKFFALLMIASLLGLPVAAPLARANEDRLGEPGSEMEQLRVLQILDEISTGERVGRYVGSSVRSALGAALITGGALATDSPTRVLLLLSGGVVTIYGIKGFFVPTPIENFAELYRSRPSGGFDDGALYFIRKTARENRLWDSALSLA